MHLYWQRYPDQVANTLDLTIILLALSTALWCVLFERIAENQEEMWKSGDYNFTAARLGRLKTHAVDGGVAWMGAVSEDFHHSLAAKQGPGTHGRATKEGCELSATAPGEGEESLGIPADLLSMGFMARTDVYQGAVPNFRFFKIIKGDAVAAQNVNEDASRDIGAPQNDLVAALRGTSWMWLFMFYFAKVPGSITFEIPGVFLALVLLSKTIGLGAFPPFRALLKAVWIVLRVLWISQWILTVCPTSGSGRCAYHCCGRCIQGCGITSASR